MISLITALVIITTEPCPNYAHLKRVHVVSETGTQYGCGMIYNEQIIYVLDNEGEQLKTELLKPNQPKEQ